MAAEGGGRGKQKHMQNTTNRNRNSISFRMCRDIEIRLYKERQVEGKVRRQVGDSSKDSEKCTFQKFIYLH